MIPKVRASGKRCAESAENPTKRGQGITDTTSHGGTGPSHRGVEIGVAVAMIAFGAVVIAGSRKVGIGWGLEGPKAASSFYLGSRLSWRAR